MRTFANLLCSCLILGGCYAQTSQAPATPDELQHFRFMLMSLASLDHGQSVNKLYDDYLVKQFGLNSQELTLIH